MRSINLMLFLCLTVLVAAATTSEAKAPSQEEAPWFEIFVSQPDMEPDEVLAVLERYSKQHQAAKELYDLRHPEPSKCFEVVRSKKNAAKNDDQKKTGVQSTDSFALDRYIEDANQRLNFFCEVIIEKRRLVQEDAIALLSKNPRMRPDETAKIITKLPFDDDIVELQYLDMTSECLERGLYHSLKPYTLYGVRLAAVDAYVDARLRRLDDVCAIRERKVKQFEDKLTKMRANFDAKSVKNVMDYVNKMKKQIKTANYKQSQLLALQMAADSYYQHFKPNMFNKNAIGLDKDTRQLCKNYLDIIDVQTDSLLQLAGRVKISEQTFEWIYATVFCESLLLHKLFNRG